MRDKQKETLRLEGRGVIMEEIAPHFFPYVIKWRNDPVLNHFLNQPEELTLEKEQCWYEECYLQDDTQGYMVMVDKQIGTPFGTLGWTDMDVERRQCISGRLLLGDAAYGNTGPFVENFFVLGDYLYGFVDRIYAHVEVKNRKAMHLNKLLGFSQNPGEIQYPEELFVQGDKSRPQVELVRTREDYAQAKKRMFTDIEDVLYGR